MIRIRDRADCGGRGIQIRKAQEKMAKISWDKFKLYDAGKCKNCKYLDFKRGLLYGEEDRICSVFDSFICPHQLTNKETS